MTYEHCSFSQLSQPATRMALKFLDCNKRVELLPIPWLSTVWQAVARFMIMTQLQGLAYMKAKATHHGTHRDYTRHKQENGKDFILRH